MTKKPIETFIKSRKKILFVNVSLIPNLISKTNQNLKKKQMNLILAILSKYFIKNFEEKANKQ